MLIIKLAVKITVVTSNYFWRYGERKATVSIGDC